MEGWVPVAVSFGGRVHSTELRKQSAKASQIALLLEGLLQRVSTFVLDVVALVQWLLRDIFGALGVFIWSIASGVVTLSVLLRALLIVPRLIFVSLFTGLLTACFLSTGILLLLRVLVPCPLELADTLPRLPELNSEALSEFGYAEHCSICLQVLDGAAEPLCHGPCPPERCHIFHVECLRQWLRCKKICPLCRHQPSAEAL